MKTLQELDVRKQAGDEIALYLRNFGEERFRYIKERPDLEGHALITPIEREFDSQLVKLVTARAPLFALANVNDPTPPEGLRQLFVEDDDWVMAADELIRNSDLIVLFLGEGSPGILRELMVIDALDKCQRTLIVLGGAMNEERLGDELRALLARFPYRARDDSIDPDAGTRRFLNRLPQ